MLDFMPATSYAPKSDYGHIDYVVATQTTTFANGKAWADRNHPNPPSALLEMYAATINTIFEEEIKPAVEAWIEEANKQVEDLREMVKSKDSQSLQTASIQKERTVKAVQNLQQVLVQIEPFLTKLTPHLRTDFMPSIVVDNEGEIDFEWYGRRGARASVTVGANGVLYFVSLFHGETHKARLLWSSSIPPIILTELDKIYKDKQA
jgi:hypothetical protein